MQISLMCTHYKGTLLPPKDPQHSGPNVNRLAKSAAKAFIRSPVRTEWILRNLHAICGGRPQFVPARKEIPSKQSTTNQQPK